MDIKVKGSYYIRATVSGWYVWHKTYVDKKKVQKAVDKKAYGELGFRKEMSVDEAKERCKTLNKERSLIKEKIRIAAKRVTEIKTVNETLFPSTDLKAFELLLAEENFGSEAHLHKLYSHFNTIQKCCNELRIMPAEYKESSKKIYKWLIKHKFSVNYSTRLISLLNRWGHFKSRLTSSYFAEVPVPGGRERAAIADAQQTKSGTETELGARTESLPLTPLALQRAKDKLSIENYNWLYLSMWLGLRPFEVDGLLKAKNFKIEFNGDIKKNVLLVYQSKLMSIAEKERWKRIPLVFDEQVTCLAIIEAQQLKRPLTKTLRKHIGAGITLYGGRKAFVDLMLGKGQKLEDISTWLGHKDISTTWKHYKDRVKVSYTEVTMIKLVSK